MSKFSELSVQLDKQIADVEVKKKAMEDFSAKLNKAAEDYNTAISLAKSTRSQIESEMNDALGKEFKPKIG